jgi:hypothetical protein
MKVFISWSGERSNALALALREWLPLVLHYVEPWLSDADIEAGDRWAQSIAKELAAANFGIVCVTSENVNSSWVLFEAGALAKSLEMSKVIPLLLDLEFSDISGPLAQFQAKKITRTGVGEILHSLQASAESPIPEDRERQLLDALWPELEKKLAEIPKKAPTQRHVRPQHEILEELVTSVRALDVRAKDSDELISQLRREQRVRLRRRPINPIAIRDLISGLLEDRDFSDGPNPVAILIFAGYFRDDAPWLYELTVEAYNAIKKKRGDSRRVIRDLIRILQWVARFTAPEIDLDLRHLEPIIDGLQHELVNHLSWLPPG